MIRRHRRVDLAITALALGVTPVALALTVGRPALTGHVGWSLGLGIASTAAWLAWAWCMVALVRQVARFMVAPSSAAAASTALDRLAAAVASVLLSIAPVGLMASNAGGSVPPVAIATVSGQASSLRPQMLASATQAALSHDGSYLVSTGDCLWSIATRLYGDGDDWTQLAAANLGHVMVDGRVFTDPQVILPGWILATPGISQQPGAASPPPSPAAAVPPASLHPEEPPAPTPRAEVPRTSSTLSAERSTGVHHGSQGAGPVDDAIAATAVLGGGTVVLGLLRRRRRAITTVATTSEHIDDEIALLASSTNPITTLVERAVIMADDDDALVGPGLLAVGSDGADLYLENRLRWHAEPADLVDDPGDVRRAPCALLAIGDHLGRSWSLLVPSGSIAHVGGVDAPSFVDDALALQPSLAWGDLLALVDHDEAASIAEFADAGALVVAAAPAGSSSIDGAALVAVGQGASPLLTIDPSTVTLLDGTIQIDRRALAPGIAALVDDCPRSQPGTLEGWRDPAEMPASLCQSPAVMVRLLTAAPRVDGLVAPFEANRARRCTEILAYLALHSPDPITGDRLRNRVLGTSQADAAAKTLFNVTSATRRALGHDADGTPHLPAAGRDGLYRVGSGVSIDVLEFATLVQQSDGAQDAAQERMLLGLALDLIEGEPMATVLSGYEWFVAEGHRARLEAAIERAASRHIELCLAHGDPDAASATLDAVTSAVPYSEILASCAMDVAAAHGDLAALTAAFEAIEHLSEELAPGTGPSDAVEARFAELRRSLCADGAAQASLAAMDAAPRSTSPSAPAAL